LFLSAGSVIHAMGDEQDMRKLGGLVRTLPLTYSLMLIGSLSLMGFPFLTGYYSKDAILELTFAHYSIKATFAYWLGAISAMCTAFYSFRLLINTFISDTRGSLTNTIGSHESPIRMLIPLILLGIGSIFVGYIMKDLVIGIGTTGLGNAVYTAPENITLINAEFLSPMTKQIPVILSMTGATIAILLYWKMPAAPVPSRDLFIFLSNKWHFDAIYNNYIVKPIFIWGLDVSYKVIDKGLIEAWGPTGIKRALKNITQGGSSLQSGQVYNYALAVILFTAIVSININTGLEIILLLPIFIILFP
jgi:NADH-ubiquinone oxidoreductase chain 5